MRAWSPDSGLFDVSEEGKGKPATGLAVDTRRPPSMLAVLPDVQVRRASWHAITVVVLSFVARHPGPALALLSMTSNPKRLALTAGCLGQSHSRTRDS